jgi:glycine/D-amino acid oxidase-like deaminating enzyme
MWRELETVANMSSGSLLNTLNGFLFMGQSAFNMAEFCRNLSIANCILLSPTEVISNHPFISVDQSGLHLRESGYINMTLLLTVLRTLVAQTANILVRDKETFLSMKHTPGGSRVHIETSRGSLNATKVIFLPGAYTKTMMKTLGLNLNISLYELPSAVLFQRSSNSSSNLTIPTWQFASNDDNHYAGYPLDQSGYVRIEPRISTATMQTLSSPYNRTNKPDKQILSRMLTWVGQHLAQTVDLTNAIIPVDTTLDSMLSDKGFILDYMPGFEQKVVLGTDSWSSIQYVPLFADILARLVVANESTPWPSDYASVLPEFSINIKGRIILQDPEVTPPPNGSTNGKDGNTLIHFSVLMISFFVFYS